MARQVAIDEGSARQGLVGLVVALVEIVHEALKLQAVRRMENRSLTEEELDRVGRALLAVERGIAELKLELGVADVVASVRSDLDGLVERLLGPVVDPAERG